jgi:hypothetical protein
MLKKIIIGLLVVTVVGAGGAAYAYNAASQEQEQIDSIQEPLMKQQGIGDAGQSSAHNSGGPVAAAEGSLGQPWQETGSITEINDFGFQFSYAEGQAAYIELGPPDYWQNQGVELRVGQSVTVVGSINEGMIHAAEVTLADGQTLQVRSETGQPLWSGGAVNGQGQNAGNSDGDHVPEPQARVDEWVTYEGTLLSFQGGSMTMSTPEGDLITFQTGQPRFFAGQGVTFQVGDEIVVIGFYENEQFMAGDITQVSTGLRVMLRDPNGRPLWAGPGNGNGNGGGNGNSGGGGNGGGNGKSRANVGGA